MFDRLIAVAALRQLYDQRGIAVGAFACPYSEACAGDALPRPLIRGMEAFVGSRYGDARRLVIISLDTGGDSEDMQARRTTIEGHKPKGANPHMRGTTSFLEELLGRTVGGASPLTYFSMLNTAKCSANDGRADMVPWALHHRCLPYMVEELGVLEPELLWLQGSTVREVLGSHLSPPQPIDDQSWTRLGIPPDLARAALEPLHREFFRSLSVNDKSIPTIVTVHPSDRYGKWAQFQRAFMPIVAAIARAKTPDGRGGMSQFSYLD
jgi:hypothetical protein